MNGTATVEELENESVTMKKMYAKDVIDFLNNMENADKIEKESKDDSPDNKNQNAFTTFINENGKSVGNTSKQIFGWDSFRILQDSPLSIWHKKYIE